MTSNRSIDDDDDYHESVSRHVSPDWGIGSSRGQLPPMSGRMWTSPRAYSAFSIRSVTGPHHHRHRAEVHLQRSRDSSSAYHCIHVTILVIGVVTILSVLAAVFIATIGLNNLASET